MASRRLPPCVGPAEHSPMVVPHLPVIRAAAPPGILNAPLPTAAPGPHSAPGTRTPVPIPTFCPGPSPSYPGTGSPVPDQSPSSHFRPGGLGRPLPKAAPGPSPQSPSPHSGPGTRPPRRPTAAPGPSPLSHSPHRHGSFPFIGQVPLNPRVFPPTPWSRVAGAFRSRSFKFSCDRVRELANVGSSHRGIFFFWARVDPHRPSATDARRAIAG